MTFNELYVGQKASVEKTFTDADLRAFAEVSLDTNPIHLDEEYAKTTGVILSAHTSLCVAPILEYGTEEQRTYVISLHNI